VRRLDVASGEEFYYEQVQGRFLIHNVGTIWISS
jgi:hypothetical protein